jgi:iron uptake system component EfeO
MPLSFLLACDGEPQSQEATAILATKAYLDGELNALVEAAEDLQAAAPLPDADGWSPAADADAVDRMRASWRQMRTAYEHVEGGVRMLFPHIDFTLDGRYDWYLDRSIDDDLYDGNGATGMHAVERILWADAHPAEVVAFESALIGYVPAAFPSDAESARRFREDLCGRLVTDARRLRDEFAPVALDDQAAYRGVIGSVEEQLEKITLASTGQDESRYSARTMADLRAAHASGVSTYAVFREWILAQPNGEAVDAEIVREMDGLAEVYATIEGDALPPVPAGFDPDAPTAEHLATPYGRLWERINAANDLESETSLISRMSAAGESIGIPRIPR